MMENLKGENMNLALITDLSLANWKSEAWIKHLWGHRKCFSIPFKDCKRKSEYRISPDFHLQYVVQTAVTDHDSTLSSMQT
jgi:hypothetical protein